MPKYHNLIKVKKQCMRNIVCHRSMSAKLGCDRLVEILGLSVTMKGYFCKILLFIQ